MEFNFNVNDVFQDPIAEIGSDLLPPKFRGDRRTLRDTVTKVTEVINAIGEASAVAQGLPRTITTADKLRNSNDQKIHLLLDKEANNGNGAVIGMLKTGHKGLYLFDRSGNNYQTSPPCVLDFYIHDKYQRKGLGKELFQHMLQRKEIQPDQMALDRPSEKLLRFLNKHYSLETPMKQMNNYVVFDGFFRQTGSEKVPEKKRVLINKGSANGLQGGPSPYKFKARNQTQVPEAMTENPASANQSSAGEQLNTQSPQYPMQNQTVSQSDPNIPYRGVQSDQTANLNLQCQENQQNYVQQTTRSEPQVCYQPNFNQIGNEAQNNYQSPAGQANQNPNSDLYMYIYLPNQSVSKQDLSQNNQSVYQPQPWQTQFQANEANANQYSLQQVQSSTAPQIDSGNVPMISPQDAGNSAYTPQASHNTNYQNQYQPTAETTNTNSQQENTYYANQYANAIQPQQPNEAPQAPYQIQNMPHQVRSQQLSNPANNVHILIKKPSNQQIPPQQPVVAYQVTNQQPTVAQPQTQQPVAYQVMNQPPTVAQPQTQQPVAYQVMNQPPTVVAQPQIQQPVAYQVMNQPPTVAQPQTQQPVAYQVTNQQPTVAQPQTQQPVTYQVMNQQPTIAQSSAQHASMYQSQIPSQQLNIQQTQSQPDQNQQLNQQASNQQLRQVRSKQSQMDQHQVEQSQQGSYQTQSQPVLQGRAAASYPTATSSQYQMAARESLPNNFIANQGRMSQRDLQGTQCENEVNNFQERNIAGGDSKVQSERNVPDDRRQTEPNSKSMDQIIVDKLQQFGYPPQAVPFKPRVLHRKEYCP